MSKPTANLSVCGETSIVAMNVGYLKAASKVATKTSTGTAHSHHTQTPTAAPLAAPSSTDIHTALQFCFDAMAWVGLVIVFVASTGLY